MELGPPKPDEIVTFTVDFRDDDAFKPPERKRGRCMEWLNCNAVRTAKHATRFLVGRNDADFERIMAAMVELRSQEDAAPDKLASIARNIIEGARPHLKDCTIVFVSFDPSTLGWEIIAEHPSLPKVSPLGELKREFLFG